MLREWLKYQPVGTVAEQMQQQIAWKWAELISEVFDYPECKSFSKLIFFIRIPCVAIAFHRDKPCKWQAWKVNLVEWESFYLLTNYFRWNPGKIKESLIHLLPIHLHDLFGMICPHDVIRPVAKSKHLLYKYNKVIFKYKCLGQSIISLNQEIWVLVQSSTIPALVKVIMFLLMTAIFSDSGSLRVGYYSSYFLSMILAMIRIHPNWSNTAMKKDRRKFWQVVFSLKHASDILYIEDLHWRFTWSDWFRTFSLSIAPQTIYIV